MIVHPDTKVDDDLVEPDTDGGFEPGPDTAWRRTPIGYCAGPGALLREYRDGPHHISVEVVEPCPTCNDDLPHEYRRVLFLDEREGVQTDG